MTDRNTEDTLVVYTQTEIDALPDDTDWKRVNAMTDEELEVLDPLTDEQYDQFEMVVYIDGEEVKLALIDPEILKWFEKHSGKDFQKKINTVLREYIDTQEAAD